MTAWPLVHLALSALSFAAALMAIAPAPTVPLFKLSVGAMEFGHWLLFAPLALLCVVPWSGALGIIAALLSLSAIALFLLTAFRVQSYARTLPMHLHAVFPVASAVTKEPFSWLCLWFPPRVARRNLEVHDFSGPENHALQLHFYRSAARTPAPCVIVIHGGGWEGGSPDEFTTFNHLLAQEGYAVAALTYRFAPQWPWPAQCDDVHAALRMLKERSPELGIDPQRFVLLGRSAGGQIAATVAYAAQDPAIRGCIAFYAPLDIRFGHKYARADDIIQSLSLVLNYMGGPPEKAGATYDDATALRFVSPSSPPTLLLHGRRDTYVWYRQSKRISRRLLAAKVPHFIVDLPWATHGFDYNPYGPDGQLATYAVLQFLASVTR
jgi:acetyl esterase/lipase